MKKKIFKKAQIEVSFHWIFILIAGVAILAFFLMITSHAQKGGKAELGEAVSGRLDSLLSALQQNPDSVQPQEMLNTELEFSCDIEGHTYKVKDAKSKTYLNSQILFSPETVGNANMITWTKTYFSPYPVVQILYFTDDKTKYIFLESTKEYYFKIPEQLEKNLTTVLDLANLKDEGFRKYVIVTDGNEEINLESSIREKATIVKISAQETNSLAPYGTVEFISPAQNINIQAVGTSRAYIDDETLYGAIISGNVDLYGCTMEKLMKVSRIVGEITLNRTGMLSQAAVASENQKCLLFYNSEIPQEYIGNIIGNSTYENTTQSYKDLSTSIISLNKLNWEMSRVSCPTIY